MADDKPISGSDAIFARAYANALKTKFNIDLGQHNVLLTSPVTQRGIAAGDLVYPQMTNYLIYKLADNLQYADNPSYTASSAGSYIQQLRRYIFPTFTMMRRSFTFSFYAVGLIGSKR
jgi:hypothetical protein